MSPTFLVEMPVSYTAYPLHAQYAHYNMQLFKSALPTDCPLEWGIIQRASGTTSCKHSPYTGLIPNTLKIVLNQKLHRTIQEFDAILIHEMIHAYFFVRNNFTEGHGNHFQAMAKYLSGIVGFEIPLTDDIRDAVIPDSVERRPLVGVFVKLDTDWISCFLAGTGKAAGNLDAVVSAVARSSYNGGKRPSHLTIIKLNSNLGYKYGVGRSTANWKRISESDLAACRETGEVLRDIASPTTALSPEQLNVAPEKYVVCGLTKDLRHNTTIAEFYSAKLADSPSDLHDLIRGKEYYKDNAESYSVVIITTVSTIPGVVIARNLRTRKGYRVNAEQVSALWTKRHKLLWGSNERWIDS